MPNRYIGPNRGRWNVTQNWSNSDNNYNTDCRIEFLTPGAIGVPGGTVTYDVADGYVGHVGSLTLVNAILQLTNMSVTGGGQFLDVGQIILVGASRIIVSPSWLINSEMVLAHDQSSITLPRAAFWDAGSFPINFGGQSAFSVAGHVTAGGINAGPFTNVTMSNATVVSHFASSGRVWFSYPPNASTPQELPTVIYGNAEVGTVCNISIGFSKMASVAVLGDLKIPNGAIPYPVEPTPLPTYNYAFCQGQAAYPDGNVLINGVSYYATFKMIAEGTILYWSQTPPGPRGGLPPGPGGNDPNNPGQPPPP